MNIWPWNKEAKKNGKVAPEKDPGDETAAIELAALQSEAEVANYREHVTKKSESVRRKAEQCKNRFLKQK